MEISTKNITGILSFATSVLAFIGIIVTYALNSKKDREMEFFKIKQKYYNALLEILIIKLSEVSILQKINEEINFLELELKKLKQKLLKTKETLLKIDKRIELNLFPENLRDERDILEKRENQLIKKIDILKEKKINRELKLSESNEKFSIEASRLPLYASKEVINYIEQSKNSKITLTLQNFCELMRKDLSSGKVKKIKNINFSGTLYN